VTTALIGMGSNIEPERYLQAAAEELRKLFPSARFSKVYQSAAVGMEGDDFLNACCFLSGLPDQKKFTTTLKDIEDRFGRDRSAGSWKSRTLDLDLLIYDGEILDDDLYKYAHVFGPAAELVTMKLPNVEAGMLQYVPLSL